MLLSRVIAELCHLFCLALACVLLYCHMCVADITVAFASLGSDMNCLTLTFAWHLCCYVVFAAMLICVMLLFALCCAVS